MRRVFRDAHELFRDQVRRFVANEIAPHYAEWEKAGVTPRSLWRRAGEEGLLNCALPEPYGLGGDFGHATVVIEELAHANFLGIGFSIHSDMVSPYLLNFGTDAQKERWLPPMTRGERPEDLHHQWRERRPGHRAGQHRSGPGRARPVAVLR
ncbi:hypothetical protein G6F57_021390 [Rhizopus arrhizus]|nr:hypothetical protein G6F57_021390 [Rhizopus arrhizus]